MTPLNLCLGVPCNSWTPVVILFGDGSVPWPIVVTLFSSHCIPWRGGKCPGWPQLHPNYLGNLVAHYQVIYHEYLHCPFLSVVEDHSNVILHLYYVHCEFSINDRKWFQRCWHVEPLSPPCAIIPSSAYILSSCLPCVHCMGWYKPILLKVFHQLHV